MAELDWLIVAPHHEDLGSVDAEIAAIAQHHNIIPQPPLTGYVTDLDIMRVVTEHECDVMHWITHTENGNLQLSDGMAVDADTLAQFSLSCKAELCIINACVGDKLAERVAYLCACDIIYSPVEISDRDASLYMAQYAAELVKADGYHEAYQAVGSHGGQYKYIRAGDSVTRGRTDHAAAIAQLQKDNIALKMSITIQGVAILLVSVLALFMIFYQGNVLSDIRSSVGEMRAELHYLERSIDGGRK